MEKGGCVIRTTAGVEIDTSEYDGFWDLDDAVALLKDGIVFVIWLPRCAPRLSDSWNGMSISTVDAVPELIELLDDGESPYDWPALDSYSNPIHPNWATPCDDDLEPLPFCVELGDARGKSHFELFSTLAEANAYAEELWESRERADGEYIAAGMYSWPCEGERATVEVPGGFRRGRRPQDEPIWVRMTRRKE